MCPKDQAQLAAEKEYDELIQKWEYVIEKDENGKGHKVWEEQHAAEEAQQIVIEKYYREGGGVHLKMSENDISLRKSYSLSDLETTQTLQEAGGWHNMDSVAQEAFLYGLGLDSHKYGWKLCEGVHLNMKGRQVKGTYLFSQERTDDEWVSLLDHNNKNVASFEAQLTNKGDPSLDRELAHMSRAEQWQEY